MESLRITNELFEDQDSKGEVVSSDTLRNDAEKWSLKGDLNLLCTLENFSQELATKCDTMQKNLDQITYESKMKGVKVKNLINDFQMLENCQFIENRVYDEEVDDVIVNGAMSSSDEQTKGDDPEKVKENIKKSLDAGLKFIDRTLNGFKQINEVSFDSEEEEDCISANLAAILKENRFNKVPLPHIVGSEMFMRDTFFITTPENGTASTADSGLKESYDERRDDDEYFSDQSSFDHETFSKPVENHIETSNDDGIFVCNGEEANNEEPLFDSIVKRKLSNENVHNKNVANVPEPSKDPFFETIRDESDEDDDLFGKLTKKNQHSGSVSKSTSSKVSSESKNLFDNLDDDDLFDVQIPPSKPPTIASNSKPKSKGHVNDNEVNAIEDDFDTINNANFKDRLSSILGGHQPKKKPVPRKLSSESSDDSVEESSKTLTAHENDSIKTKKNNIFNEPLRVESDGDSDDDLFGKSSKSRSRLVSAPKSTERKLSSESKKLFDDVNDMDSTKVPRKNSKLSIFDDDENDDLFSATKKINKSSSMPISSTDVSSKTKSDNKSSDNGAKSGFSNDLFAESEDDDLFSFTKKASKPIVSNVSLTKPKPAEDAVLNSIENSVEDSITGDQSNFKDRLNAILGGQQKKKSPTQKIITASAESREEPLFNSNSDFESKYDSANKSVSIKSNDVIIPEPSKDTFYEPVCDENDSDSGDDLFDNFLKRPQRSTAAASTAMIKSETKSLFDDLDDEDDEDTDSSPVLQKASNLNMFADDDNDDLFSITKKDRSRSTLSASVNSTKSKPEKVPTEMGVKLAGALFAETDDDDLFSTAKEAPKKPPPVSTSKPMSLNPVSNSTDIKISDTCGTLNNSMFKDRAKLGAQRRKRNPTRKSVATVDNEKPFLDSVEEPMIKSVEEDTNIKSESIVRETSKDISREPLFSESDGDSEDDLFGKSTKRKNRPSSAPKSSTATNKLSIESKKLFDDLDDNLFNQSSTVRRDSKLKLFAGDEDDDLFNTKSKSEQSRAPLADPLFDDDDDLFSRK